LTLCVVPAQEPDTSLQKSLFCKVYGSFAGIYRALLTLCVVPAQEPDTSLQKSPILCKRALYFAKEPYTLQKSLFRPYIFAKEPYTLQKSPILGKRALYFAKEPLSTLHLCKRAMFISTKAYIPALPLPTMRLTAWSLCISAISVALYLIYRALLWI